MCTVSAIGDHYTQKWNQGGAGGAGQNVLQPLFVQTGPTQADFDALKKEVAEMKELLLKAKAYDEKTGQKDCEQESKIALLRKIADAVGISLDDVFGPKKE